MSVELVNPPGLPVPEVHAQLSVATGARTVHLSGQVARDADGNPVGTGDLAAQVEQAYANVVTALAVVDWPPDKMATLGEGVGRVAAPGSYVPGPSPTARGSIRTVRRWRWRAWN